MGFGLNLGIPDPRQWKKQQVSQAVVDEERVSFSRFAFEPVDTVFLIGSLIFDTIERQVLHKVEIKRMKG